MALDFLSKWKKSKAGASKSGSGGTGNSGSGNDGGKRDPRKAAAFFHHAETTADSRNYDYSIECYVNGLRHDPDNLARHESLREVAKRRKVARGKPAKVSERLKTGGPTPIAKMLHAEKIWSMDPLNVASAMKVMEHAVEADKANDDLDLAELAYWLGENVLEMIQATKKPDKPAFLQVCDLFARIPAYAKAVKACQMALSLDPGNGEILKKLKELEAESALQEGHYGSGQEGDFRANIKDADRQRALEDDDAISKTASLVDSTIERRRAEFKQNPEDLNRLHKLITALREKEDRSTEDEAIELLQQSWEQTNQYKFKMELGDIRMQQMRREIRQTRSACEADASETEARKKLKDLTSEAARFELQEFIERVENYPTDMRIRFELGRRLFTNNKLDEAISEFQKAQGDPKHRAASCEYLGRCYIAREWFDEAIDVLNRGIETHRSHDDRLGMELRYLKMDVLEKAARQTGTLETAQEAQKMASQILQTNIKYRDIRTRMDSLKKLVVELQQK